MKARQGELIHLYQLYRLHSSRERAERTGRLFTVGARLAAGAAVLLGWLAAGLLWWHPDPAGLRQALVVGGTALGCGALWAVLLRRATLWLRRGMIADAGSEPPRVAGLVPDNWGDPEWLWNTLRIMNLVLLGIPIAGLVMGLGAVGSPEDIEKWVSVVRWPLTGGALLLTGLMGGIVGGLSVGFGAETEECWTPRGAVGWLVVYGVPFLLAVPWLSGHYEIWAGALVALAALWLLIAPVNKVATNIPSVSSD